METKEIKLLIIINKFFSMLFVNLITKTSTILATHFFPSIILVTINNNSSELIKLVSIR
jgi:hypothetical protein